MLGLLEARLLKDAEDIGGAGSLSRQSKHLRDLTVHSDERVQGCRRSLR
jgi:hypothetical protein